MKGTFRSLRNANYRTYAAGALLSNVGTWMQRIGQDWLVLQLSDNSGAAIGITTAFQFLPVLLLSPLAGLLADQYSKRRLMQVTQVMMAVPSLLLGFLAVTGVAEIWHVYVIAFVFGVGSALDAPARQSFVPELVDREDLTNAVGLNAISFNSARVIGPAIAGGLIAALGSDAESAGWVMLFNALSYFAVIYALQRVDPRKLNSPRPSTRRRGMILDAARYVRRRGDLLFVFLVAFFTGAFGINFQLISALVATEKFDRGAGSFGLLGSTLAIGTFAAALSTARRSDVTIRRLAWASMALGLSFVVASVLPTYYLFAAWTPVIGYCLMTAVTTAHAAVQLRTDPGYRGRVTALYIMISMGGVPLGAPVLGAVGEAFGVGWTLAAGGAVIITSAAGGYVLWGRGQARAAVATTADPVEPQPDVIG